MPELKFADAAGPAPMNILLFIDGLGSGGAQRQFSHLARGLAGRGHSVTVAVYNDQDHFAADISKAGVEIVRLAKSSRFSPKPIIGLGRLYRKCSAEVVIAFLRSPATKAELASLMFPEMKIIAAERSAYPTSILPLTLRLTQRLHGLAQFITVNSNNQRIALGREFPTLAKRVVTIRNGVELPEAIVSPTSTNRELCLIAVSNLMPYKNSVRLAEALAVLRDEKKVLIRLSWLGETFENMTDYGAYRQTCARIHALKLEDQWRWLGVRQDVSRVLAEHDALIHPSLFEGTSNAVCEAMALGLPILAGNVADHEEMIGRTGAGILFDPLDVRSMVNAIAQFASLDSFVRQAMGRKGRKVIENHYTFDQMVVDYETLASAAARGDQDPPATFVRHNGKSGECAE